MNNISNIVVYNDGELELKVSVNEETIWLNQSQMSELFGTSTDNVGLHLKNIYKEKELNENSTTENYSVVRQEGNRKVTRVIKHYNLDANYLCWIQSKFFQSYKIPSMGNKNPKKLYSKWICNK